VKAIVYLPLRPEVAKSLNLPVKLPVLAEDLLLITDQNNIPLDVILRGLEAQYEVTPDDYWKSYLVFFYYEKFKDLINKAEYTMAGEYLNKAKALTYDYRFHFYNALLQAKLSNYELAEIEFKQAITLNPTFSLAHYELGNVLFARKDYDEALEYYKRAYELNPEFLLPLMKIGDIYTELGQLDDAEIVYNMVIQKFKGAHLEGFNLQPIPEVYLRLGVVYNIRQQHEKAEKIFKEGLKLSKKPEIIYNLSYTLMKLGKHFEAYGLLLELSKEYPVPEVLNELGIIQRRLGLYEEAYETFQKVQDDFRENYERIQYFVGKKSFEEDFVNELKDAERVLEHVEFPFPEALEVILKTTDDEGNLLVDKFAEELGLTPKSMDNQEPDLTWIPYVLAAMYIAGTDPIMMEKNTTLATIATYGAGLALACSTTLLRLYQFILSKGRDIDDFIESVVPELEELHFNFSRALASLTEKPLDDFFEEESNRYDELILNLVKLIGYTPTDDELESISCTTLKTIGKFFLELTKK